MILSVTDAETEVLRVKKKFRNLLYGQFALFLLAGKLLLIYL